jgi:hypothetical protein
MAKFQADYYAKSKVKDSDILVCTFDTETLGLGGSLLCVTWSTPLDSDIKIGAASVDYWLDNIFLTLPSPCVHFAHFAQYDWRYIIPVILKRGFDDVQFNLRTESDIYQIVIKHDGKKYIMRDSYAVYSDTLDNLTKMFAPELPKLHIDFDNENFDIHNQSHLDYAIRDAQSLRVALINYFDSIYNLFGVTAGHTVAGTAMRAWQKTLDDNLIISYSQDGENEQYIRDAYYGGIVFLTNNEQHKNAVTFDINSSYPYIMQSYDMPLGRATQTQKYQDGKLAIYDVSIIAPDNLRIAILPSRNARGGMEFRRGLLRTKITNYELDYALLNGYVLQEIHGGLYWKETINPFYDFVEKCKSIRKEHKGKSYEKIAKLMQNSVYGKFGARRERVSVIVGYENLDLDKGGISPFSDDLDDLFLVEEYSDDMPCKPEWSVFITALARLRLISTAYAVGVDNVLYGDTDSLTVKEQADISAIDVGDEYGQFKMEKTWEFFRAIAPKTYAGKIKGGKWTGAGKGLTRKSMNEKKYKELYYTEKTEVEYLSLSSLMVSMKKGFKPAVKKSRVSSDIKKSGNFNCENGNIILKYANG